MSYVDKEAVEMVVHELQRSLIQADVDVAMVAELSKKIKKKFLKTSCQKDLH